MKRRFTLLLLLAAAACNPQPGRVASGPATPTPQGGGAPPLHITGRLTHPILAQRGNRRLYSLAARNYDGISPQGAARTTFYHADITFYDKHGGTLEARAPQAVVEQASHTVTMSGGVTAHSSSGLLLTCATLVYDSGDETLHGEGNVRASNVAGATIAGSRFDSDVALNHIRIR